MWPFRRRAEEPAADTAAATAAAAVAVAPRVPEWTALPALERTIPPLPLTVERDRFEGGLSALVQPPLKLAPLGHSVSEDAPAGVIGDLATVARDAAPATLALPGLPLPLLQPPPVAPELTAEPVEPVRQLPVSSPVSVAPPERGPLTVAPLPSLPPRPLPLVASRPVHDAVVAAPTTTTASSPVPDAPLLADLPLPVAPITEPEVAAQSSAPDTSMPLPIPPPAAATPPTPEAPTIPRRLGLGAPVDPAATPVAPHAEADLPLPLPLPDLRPQPATEPLLDIATPIPPEVIAPLLGERSPLTELADDDTSATSGDDLVSPQSPAMPTFGGGAPTKVPGLGPSSTPASPLPRSAPPAQARGGATVPAPKAPAAAGPQRAPEAGASSSTSPMALASAPKPSSGAGAAPRGSRPGAGPTMPLLSNRPLSPIADSAAELIPFAVKSVVEQAVGTRLPDVAVHRGSASTEAAKSIQAQAFTDNGEVHLPGHHGSLDSGPAQALLAHELVHVAQQQRLGDSRPPEHSPAGQQLEQEARAVEHAMARSQGPLPLHQSPKSPRFADPAQAAIDAGVGRRAPDGSIVFDSPPPGAPEPPAPVTAPTPSKPQRAVTIGEVETQVESESATTLSATTFEKIFTEVVRRLKAELRLERQRHGTSLDPRR